MAKRPSKVQRRRHILESARVAFSQRGYAATRMIDIAGKAKVGKGTLYEYFPSKVDLFTTLVLVTMREALETLADTTVSEEPEQALADTIRYLVEVALVENLDLYRLFYDFWGVSAAQRLEVQRRLREVSSSFREFLAGLVRRGQRSGVFRGEVDPDQFARALSAAVDGLSLQLVILGDKINLSDYAGHLQELFLAGLAAGGALGGASIIREGK